jgi:alpha-tubulin suppressor-like RCC1 family protein
MCTKFTRNLAIPFLWLCFLLCFLRAKKDFNPEYDFLWYLGARVDAVALGGAHTCALVHNNTQYVMCWGSNSNGQLGISNSTSVSSFYPRSVSFPQGVSCLHVLC